MPFPVFFIGTAMVAAGGAGLVKTAKAGKDAKSAHSLNAGANDLVTASAERLNAQRDACGNAISALGKEKASVLEGSIRRFLDTFTKIKNVDFRGSEGLSDLSKVQIDESDFEELEVMTGFATSVVQGAVAGTAGGAFMALGAYGAASMLATASTGTAIASLSGVAATNATLAFFGGGSLAVGGLGVAGGTAVLGGIVAGPALLVLGLVAGHAASKELDKAKTNLAEAIQISSQFEVASLQCEAIWRRSNLFYNLLARLDVRFLPLIFKLEDVIEKEGVDYRTYSEESKAAVASCASVAVAIKAVLDTPMLTDDGVLTDQSRETASNTEDFLRGMGVIK